jgi:hypothetical protein
LETPGPWRPEWLKNAVGVHRSMKTSRMRRLTLACTARQRCVIFGADATDAPATTPDATESSGPPGRGMGRLRSRGPRGVGRIGVSREFWFDSSSV